jgi:hypothetical protein
MYGGIMEMIALRLALPLSVGVGVATEIVRHQVLLMVLMGGLGVVAGTKVLVGLVLPGRGMMGEMGQVILHIWQEAAVERAVLVMLEM